MRETPTWRIPAGIISLFVVLCIYAALVAVYLNPLIDQTPFWIKVICYIALGVVWLLPLRRFLIWMETGSWSPPVHSEDAASEPD